MPRINTEYREDAKKKIIAAALAVAAEEFARIFDNNRILIRDCLVRKKVEGKLPRDVDPETASSAIIALTLGLRISSLFLGKDADATKKIWIDSIERILLI